MISYVKFIFLAMLVILALSCSPHCLDCDIVGATCFACDSGYELSITGQCHLKSIPNCIMYGLKEQCYMCQPTYRTQNNKCTKDFTGCLNFDSQGKLCYQCGFGLKLKNGYCEGIINCQSISEGKCTVCSKNYQLKNNICVNGQSTCQSIRQSDGICEKCKDGYSLQGYECVQKDKLINNCYLTPENKECQYCKTGYSLYRGQCLIPSKIKNVLNPQSGYEIIDRKTNQNQLDKKLNDNVNKNIKNINNKKTNVKVISTNIINKNNNNNNNNNNKNNNYNINQKNSNNTKNNDINNSNNNNNKVNNNQNKKNTNIDPNKCNPQPSIIPHCLKTQISKCIECQPKYILRNGLCYNIINFCIQYNQNGTCLNCENRFKLNDGRCVDLNCLKKDTQYHCLQCKDGYSPDNQYICKDKNCKVVHNGQCRQCGTKFTLNNAKLCVPNLPDNCQKVDEKDYQKCIKCINRWYPINGKCARVPKFCEDYDLTNGNCLSCKYSLTLQKGRCYDLNCAAGNDDICTKCVNNYEFNANGICEYNDPKCVQKSGSKCTQCVDGYYVNIEGKCIILPPNCKCANIESGSCLQCSEGYQKDNSGQCIIIPKIQNCEIVNPKNLRQCLRCLNRYYPKGGQCARVPKFCEDYDLTNGNCLSCKYSLTLQKGRCYDLNCAAGNDDICTKCVNNYEFNANGICEYNDPKCVQKSGSKCTQCVDGYYVNIEGKCIILPPNCKCANIESGSCLQCSEGYQKDNSGQCIIIPKIQNCEIVNPKNLRQCLRCLNRYYPKGGQCARVPKFCEDYDLTNGNCLSCKYSLTLQKGRCYDLNCAAGNDDICTKCVNNYEFNANGICEYNDPKCVQKSGSKCTQCVDGYYVNIEGKCIILPSNCKCANIESGSCLQCSEGYQKDNSGQCIIIPKIQNCEIVNPKNLRQCLRCLNRYYPKGGQCARVPKFCEDYDLTNGNCLSCKYSLTLQKGRCYDLNCAAGNDDICTKCVNNYEFNANGICEYNDPKCVQKSGSKCTQCVDGYYVNIEGKCIILPSNCKCANIESGSCLQCSEGYQKDNSGQCIIIPKIQNCEIVNPKNLRQCLRCLNRYYPKGGQCARVPKFCEDYDLTNGNCLSCKYSLTLQKGRCYDLNCAAGNDDICTKCVNNYEFNANGICEYNDPKCVQKSGSKCTQCVDGYYVNIEGKCIILPSNCKCANIESGSCLQCSEGYQKDNSGQCIIIPKIQNCEIVNPKNLRQCLRCLNRYYPKGGQCARVPKFCEDYDLTNGNCLSCKYSLTLQKGRCYDLNCAAGNDDICTKCVNNYEFNANGICEYNDPKCVQKSGSKCTQCVDGYYVNIEGKCIILPSNCKCANIESGSCLQCSEGYQKDNSGQCIIIPKIQNCEIVNPKNLRQCLRCLNRYYLKGGQCARVPKFCNQYDLNNGNCINCVNGFILSNYTCVDPNCDIQNQDGCLKCKFNYSFKQGRCLFLDPNCEKNGQDRCLKCKDNYYLFDNKICLKSIPNCESYNPLGGCKECINNFILKNGECIQKKNIINCLKIDQSNSKCQKCKDYYYPYEDKCKQIPIYCQKYDQKTGNCLVCIKNYQLSNGKCVEIPVIKDQNCLNFQQGRCIKCKQNYYYDAKSSKCLSKNPLCKNYNEKGQCTECYSGCIFSSGNCIVNKPDSHCQTFMDGVCKKCYDGFYVKDGTCKQANRLCKGIASNGDCLDCYPGYTLREGQCIVFNKDPNCRTYNNFDCVQCAYRYYFGQNHLCLAVDVLCNGYDKLNGQCTSCYGGYALYNGKCISRENSDDPKCKTYNNGKCIECSDNCYLKDNRCVEISSLCKTADIKTGQCTSCYSGFTLEFGKCLSNKQFQKDQNCKESKNNKCIECYQGYFLSLSGKCIQMNSQCKTSDISNGNCTSCYPGYSLVQGNCIILSNQDRYCIKFINGRCGQCVNGYYLSSKENCCKPANPLCKKLDTQNGSCLQCFDNYSLKSGNCIENKTISIIDKNCLQFDYNQKKCLKCDNGLTPCGPNCS